MFKIVMHEEIWYNDNDWENNKTILKDKITTEEEADELREKLYEKLRPKYGPSLCITVEVY